MAQAPPRPIVVRNRRPGKARASRPSCWEARATAPILENWVNVSDAGLLPRLWSGLRWNGAEGAAGTKLDSIHEGKPAATHDEAPPGSEYRGALGIEDDEVPIGSQRDSLAAGGVEQ